MTVLDAIARSITHNEIVRCVSAGDESDLRMLIEMDTAAFQDYDISYENDDSLDVYSLDSGPGAWRIKVTLLND
tara:strand:- start:1541 stop:1762 length:222 start_codon:yes stop_codon:yes gene_type:complete